MIGHMVIGHVLDAGCRSIDAAWTIPSCSSPLAVALMLITDRHNARQPALLLIAQPMAKSISARVIHAVDPLPLSQNCPSV